MGCATVGVMATFYARSAGVGAGALMNWGQCALGDPAWTPGDALALARGFAPRAHPLALGLGGAAADEVVVDGVCGSAGKNGSIGFFTRVRSLSRALRGSVFGFALGERRRQTVEGFGPLI